MRSPRRANAEKYAGKSKSLAEWASLGFLSPNGKGFKNGKDRATLKLPAGANGPAFLMTKNFYVIKKYNAADSYAMGVGMLADQIAGYGGVKQNWPRPQGTLDIKQKFELQTRMKKWAITTAKSTAISAPARRRRSRRSRSSSAWSRTASRPSNCCAPCRNRHFRRMIW
jgi:hypothetical protein